MTARPRFIYYVFGDDGVVRYVGVSVNPRFRLRQHRAESRMKAESGSGMYAFHAWLVEQAARNGKINLRIVRAAGDDWRADEQAEIDRLLRAGVPLLNVCIDGQTTSRRKRYVHLSSPNGVTADHAVTNVMMRLEAHEHAAIVERAGGKGNVSAYLRTLLGLPARKVGRPRKPKLPKPRE